MKSSNGQFEASVLVRGRPIKEIHHRGRSYIEGRQGTDYTLRFRNPTYKTVLVVPSVDGLCVIDGKPAGKDSPGYIVEGRGEITVPGWVVDAGTAAKFTFHPQNARRDKTYVEELESTGANVDPGNQGLIGFMVFEEATEPVVMFASAPTPTYRGRLDPGYYPKGNLGPSMRRIKSPSDASDGMMFGGNAPITLSSSSASMSSATMDWHETTVEPAGLGTGFGEATEFKTSTETFDRGRVIAQMVLEYDTLKGLKDRGVPVDLFKAGRQKYPERSAFPADQTPSCNPPKGWKR